MYLFYSLGLLAYVKTNDLPVTINSNQFSDNSTCNDISSERKIIANIVKDALENILLKIDELYDHPCSVEG